MIFHLRADNDEMKIALTILVYLGFVIALAVISVLARRPEPIEVEDDDF